MYPVRASIKLWNLFASSVRSTDTTQIHRMCCTVWYAVVCVCVYVCVCVFHHIFERNLLCDRIICSCTPSLLLSSTHFAARDADLIMLGLATHEPYSTCCVRRTQRQTQGCFTCGQMGHNASECTGATLQFVVVVAIVHIDTVVQMCLVARIVQ